MEIVVEETLDPTISEDPIPKWNVVPNPLRDEDDGLVEALELEGIEMPVVDEVW